jgi:hypothetical protein
MNLIEGKKCEFCGADAKNFYFSAFVCDSEECVNKAFDACGGPGRHRLNKDEPN